MTARTSAAELFHGEKITGNGSLVVGSKGLYLPVIGTARLPQRHVHAPADEKL